MTPEEIQARVQDSRVSHIVGTVQTIVRSIEAERAAALLQNDRYRKALEEVVQAAQDGDTKGWMIASDAFQEVPSVVQERNGVSEERVTYEELQAGHARHLAVIQAAWELLLRGSSITIKFGNIQQRLNSLREALEAVGTPESCGVVDPEMTYDWHL